MNQIATSRGNKLWEGYIIFVRKAVFIVAPQKKSVYGILKISSNNKRMTFLDKT